MKTISTHKRRGTDHERIKAGVCSIAFRTHSIDDLVKLAAKAGLSGIEWGGDAHVPPGSLTSAKEALDRTRDAGLQVSSYGSYHRVLDSAGNVQDFRPVLESALALETDTIRIWAGCKGSDIADEIYRGRVVEESRRIAEQAAKHDVRVAFEFHAKTLTDTHQSALALLNEISHSNMYIYWQPIYWGPGLECRLAGLDALRGRILNLHVFYWNYASSGSDFYSGIDRRPLEEGAKDWSQYLAESFSPALPHFALIEHVRDDSPEQFLKDAAVLKDLINRRGDG